ncbi:MAG: hypothetical protein IIA87_03250 [Nanoarchaeota archaeon]|nr:hypothetical protein [Nanoarchaeota archaeon]
MSLSDKIDDIMKTLIVYHEFNKKSLNPKHSSEDLKLAIKTAIISEQEDLKQSIKRLKEKLNEANILNAEKIIDEEFGSKLI